MKSILGAAILGASKGRVGTSVRHGDSLCQAHMLDNFWIKEPCISVSIVEAQMLGWCWVYLPWC